MGVNKVEYGGRTLIDLTGDTVTPETLVKGATAHNAAGELIEGENAGSSGDMLKSDYDPENEVQEAGGIAAYVDGTVYSDDAETMPETILSTTEEVLRKVYPVGAIYMSVNSASPADLFGFGTWQRVKDRFLLAAGDNYSAGATGGEATHTLTVSEMPSHSHVDLGINENRITCWSSTNNGNGAFILDSLYQQNGVNNNILGTGWAGGSAAHNNMPPYLTVYIWQRTA